MVKTNDLQPLSKDLTTITTEIKSYENIAGQSVFEIGRRLNWVKENDLAHGQFRKWLESVNINYRQANRFMKVANNLPNVTTWSHLGMRVLYEIATLPESQQDQVKEEVEQGYTPTVSEISKLKKQLSDARAENEDLQSENSNMRKQQVALNQQLTAKQETKVVEREVPKEVVPSDYHELKQRNADLEKEKAKLAHKVDAQQEELDGYKDLESQERQAKHWETRGKLSAYKLISNTRDYLRANALTTDDKNTIASADSKAHDELTECMNDLIERAQKVIELTNGRLVIEGDVTND